MITRRGFASGLTWADGHGLGKQRPAYSTNLGAMFQTDAIDVLKALPKESVDLVFTSPPFALTRKKEYGNEPVERYLAWFKPFCEEIKRVLKPTGSFVLDIGGAWLPGVPTRSVYHFEVAINLVKSGLHLAQDFYWYNPASLPNPTEWVNVRRIRVKNAVNVVWWFGKTEYPKADNKKILLPYSESMKTLFRDGYNSGPRPSGHNISKKFSKDNGGAIPPNLLSFANTESNSCYMRACKKKKIKPHPARFPAGLVQFFLKFLTDANDIVLDPFAGSNMTGSICEAMGRRWLATETVADYVTGSACRFDDEALEEQK